MPDVEGLDELVKALGETSLNLGQKKRLIAKSLRKGATLVKEEQQRLAPDDPETHGSRIKEAVGISVVDQSATSGEARVGPTKWSHVSRFAEFGTSHQTATPHVGPSLDNKQSEAVAVIGETLGDGIEETFYKNG